MKNSKLQCLFDGIHIRIQGKLPCVKSGVYTERIAFTNLKAGENSMTNYAAALAALQGELFQRAAGKLLPALAALPDGDSALLSDSMSDEDYQAFLNLLGL